MLNAVGRLSSGTRSTMLRPKPSRPPYLRRVVRHQPHGRDAQVDEDLRADAVLARVDRQPELEVGVDRVAAVLLEGVGADLVAEADAAALVTAQVHDDARALGGDLGQRRVQLGSAVTAQRAEDVAGQALGVHPHEDVGASLEISP